MRNDLIKELRDGYDNEPSALPKEADRMAELMNEAADAIEAKEVIKNMSVWEKVFAVTAEIGKVQMTLDVDTGKGSYKAISINDVVDSLIPLMTKYRLIAVPLEKEIVEQEQITTTNKYGERTQFYVRMRANYAVVNIDKPEERITACGYGDGIDSGDKATGKAITYARKYALIDIFNLSKGDDPDREASQEYQPVGRAEPEQIAKITQLYSEKEIGSMLKRLKKTALTHITYEQAATMIAKRDQSLLKDNTETF